MKIANAYVPPASSCPNNYVVLHTPLHYAGAITIGDLNAHDDELSAAAGDPRGAHLNEIDTAGYVVLNNLNIATRPVSACSPDVALAPPSLALNIDWSVNTTLDSNHLPVHFFHKQQAYKHASLRFLEKLSTLLSTP